MAGKGIGIMICAAIIYFVIPFQMKKADPDDLFLKIGRYYICFMIFVMFLQGLAFFFS